MWLQANNPFYADVAIDYGSLQRLPEDGVPDDLPTVDHPASNEEKDANKKMQNIRFHTRVIHFFHFHSENRLNRMQYAH